MSQVDGSIEIRFTGSQAALAKLEQFMGEELASFRSFRDCAVSYDPAEHSLDLDLDVRCEDILNFLGLVVSQLPEVGFSGEADLDYVGCGEQYYAIYQHEPGGVFQMGEIDGWEEDPFSLDLRHDSEEEERVSEWLNGLPFPVRNEADSDDGYYKGDYWVYEEYEQEVRLRAYAPTAEELGALGEALKALAAQVPSLEGDTAYHNSDALIVVDIHPGQEARVVTVPIEIIPTGREDEFEDDDDDDDELW